jgi:dissimilatory sulfite reductase alpha subunit
MADYKTPLIDELEKGPWPSFVTEIKKAAQAGNEMSNDLLGQLEKSYRDKRGYWKHGGIVGVMGYGGGVIGRYTALADEFPAVEHFHTVRVNQPAGWYYDTKAIRFICDLWEKTGSGLTNMHGSTGDMVLLGCKTEQLEPIFKELTVNGWDLGGSGSDLRTPSCCCGESRCEFACYDTMAMCHDFTNHWQDELHRPAFPYKFKFKFAGCPNDCVASIARSDLAFIGTWKDDIQQDDAEVKAYADGGMNIARDVVGLCPTKCMSFDGSKLTIDNGNCVKCMHCINVMPKALRVGKEKGVTLLIGAKAPIVEGALFATMLIPFVEAEAPYEDIKEVIEAIWDPWAEEGKNRERVGEFIQRVGLGNFIEAVGLDPEPKMISQTRDNPYIFFETEDEE